jgi:hypothetical protein
MKKRFWSLLMSVSVLVPLLGIGAQAQYVVKLMKVDVPFEFQVRDKSYPAGNYIVRREGTFVFLRDNKERLLIVMNVNSLRNAEPAATSKLVFFDYHGLHLLTQILWEGDRMGVEVVRKGREVDVAKRVAPPNVERAEAGNKP